MAQCRSIGNFSRTNLLATNLADFLGVYSTSLSTGRLTNHSFNSFCIVALGRSVGKCSFNCLTTNLADFFSILSTRLSTGRFTNYCFNDFCIVTLCRSIGNYSVTILLSTNLADFLGVYSAILSTSRFTNHSFNSFCIVAFGRNHTTLDIATIKASCFIGTFLRTGSLCAFFIQIGMLTFVTTKLILVLTVFFSNIVSVDAGTVLKLMILCRCIRNLAEIFYCLKTTSNRVTVFATILTVVSCNFSCSCTGCRVRLNLFNIKVIAAMVTTICCKCSDGHQADDQNDYQQQCQQFLFHFVFLLNLYFFKKNTR